MLNGTELLLVAAIVTKEFVTGVVVPKVEGVVVPETAPASWANDAAEMRWRGESVSEVMLSEDTSTCKKISLLVLKL